MWATRLAGVGAAARGDMFFHATIARTFISALRLRGDDDFVDRLNYYFTPIMLSIACLIISAKQYGGTPIECWVNPHSRESMEEYIESYCWIQNTYWVPMYENIPDDHTARDDRQIGYYQWVPFILIAEALMFSLPCILWRLLSWQSGLNIQQIIHSGCEVTTMVDAADRARGINSLSSAFIDMLDLQSNPRQPTGRSLLARFKCAHLLAGHHITALYLLTKLLYTLNIMIQFMVLNAALKSNEYMLFGFQVLTDLIAGKPWTESGHFPRVTLCDFEVRYLANLNRYTVQCALLINIINEKVFAFFWVWYLILMLITSCSTLFWLSCSALETERLDYVHRFLTLAENSELRRENKKSSCADQRTASPPMVQISAAPHLFDLFVLQFLKADGVFILRLLANHAGDVIVMQLVRNLWAEFRDRNWLEFEEAESSRIERLRSHTTPTHSSLRHCNAMQRGPHAISILPAEMSESMKSDNYV